MVMLFGPGSLSSYPQSKSKRPKPLTDRQFIAGVRWLQQDLHDLLDSTPVKGTFTGKDTLEDRLSLFACSYLKGEAKPRHRRPQDTPPSKVPVAVLQFFESACLNDRGKAKLLKPAVQFLSHLVDNLIDSFDNGEHRDRMLFVSEYLSESDAYAVYGPRKGKHQWVTQREAVRFATDAKYEMMVLLEEFNDVLDDDRK